MIFKVSCIDRNKSGIYKILNTISNKFYVGSTTCFRRRYNVYMSDLRKNKCHNEHLLRSYLKNGATNFEFHILELCSRENIYSREQYYLDTLKPEYNICLNANEIRVSKDRIYKGGFRKGYIRTPEHTARIVESAKKRREAGISNQQPGHSEETKLKLSIINKGKKIPTEVINRIRQSSIGRVITEETRLKISIANKGKQGPNKGSKRTKEDIVKMREGWKKKRELVLML